MLACVPLSKSQHYGCIRLQRSHKSTIYGRNAEWFSHESNKFLGFSTTYVCRAPLIGKIVNDSSRKSPGSWVDVTAAVAFVYGRHVKCSLSFIKWNWQPVLISWLYLYRVITMLIRFDQCKHYNLIYIYSKVYGIVQWLEGYFSNKNKDNDTQMLRIFEIIEAKWPIKALHDLLVYESRNKAIRLELARPSCLWEHE